jgi:hypothetical protein
MEMASHVAGWGTNASTSDSLLSHNVTLLTRLNDLRLAQCVGNASLPAARTARDRMSPYLLLTHALV